ncbi:MAG: phospho-N-acetylmuramoyl-pentapeptide-transferase, partial [bacterium]
LLLLIMLSGYLDDAADVPWSDYKKGAIDFVISLITMVCFVMCSPTDIMIFHMHIVLPKIIYGLLGIILIWVSINVVNCTDGVDGLCGNLTLVSLLSFVFAFSQGLGIYNVYVLIMCGVILAYLYYNSSPSSMLMGDAGSRAFGYFLALIAMKSQHPFAFIIFALVMIIDGGLGLVKIFIIRFFHIKGFMRQIRTPIHDEMRKKRSWQDPLVVARFTAIQIVLSALLLVLL